MIDDYCEWHYWLLAEDGPPPHPDIDCSECRALGLFTPEQIQRYENQPVAIYRRPGGFPGEIIVVLRDTDREDYARSICPAGSWRFISLTHGNPKSMLTANASIVERPEDGMTLEDTRRVWDYAPPHCY